MSKRELSFIDRLERMEPYVANRILLLQGGFAMALAIAAKPTGPIPEVLNFLPFSLGGVAQETVAFKVGYPLRELIWAGEIWRGAVGVFLPPGFGVFLLFWLSVVPFAKALESRLSRIHSFLVYLAGGASVVATDLLTGTGITSGGVGMIYSAAGAVWFLERRQPSRNLPGTSLAPRQNVVFLVLLGLLCLLPYWGEPELEGEMAQLGVTLLTPSAPGLVAGLLAGVSLAPLLSSARLREVSTVEVQTSGPSTSPLTETLDGRRRLWVAPWVAGMSLLAYGVVGWWIGNRLDYAVWKNEPPLLAGQPEGERALLRLVESYPEDRFLKKRLAVQYLRQRQWSRAEPLLTELEADASSWTPAEGALQRLRALRLTHLNLRATGHRLSWSYSGISVNYQVAPEWLAVELGHLARLAGDEKSLDLYRKKALEKNENLLRARAGLRESGETPASKARFESLILNDRAYLRTELNGNLAVAIEEASRSVALDMNSFNLDTLGWIQFKDGQLEKGIESLGRSLQTAPSSASGTTYYHLGAAYHASGETEKSQFYFKEALRRDLPWWEELDLLELCPECNPLSAPEKL